MSKGTYEFVVETGKAGFRYDMVAGDYLEKSEGKEISEILDDLVTMAQHAKEGMLKVRLGLLLNLLHAGASSYAEFTGTESPSRSLVSEWANQIDSSELYTMVFEGMQMFVPKNSKALKTRANGEVAV